MADSNLGEPGKDFKPREDKRSPECPDASKRRTMKILGTGFLAMALGLRGDTREGVEAVYKDTPDLAQPVVSVQPPVRVQRKKPSAPKVPETLEPAPTLTENAVSTFKQIFSETGEQVFFIDDNYKIVGGPFRRPNKRDFKKLKKAKETPHKKYSSFKQAWYNDRRQELKDANPEIEFSLELDDERPFVKRGTDSFAEVSENSQQTIDDQNILEFLYENFDTELQTLEFANDYPELADYVSEFFVFGALGQETKYQNRDNGTAKGIWQFTKDTARDCGLTVNLRKDERTDPQKSSCAAARCVNKSYLYLADRSPIFEIMKEFEVDPKDFLVPCMVNAYQAGMGSIRKMLTWFYDNYPRDVFEAEFGKKAWDKDLYFLMSKLYMESGEGRRYKEESRSYYLMSLTMYEEMRGL
jgi:hypothetical protein